MGNCCFNSSTGTNTRENTGGRTTPPSGLEAQRTQRTENDILSSPNIKAFDFIELKKATYNFHFQLGEGGFGVVYKGWLDSQTLEAAKNRAGMMVAVKKLKADSFQGHKEFMTEINYLDQYQHSNLVKLIGYCLAEPNRLLVYELLPQGSLDSHLFKRTVPWKTRIKIAIGAARGLAFLHNSNPQLIFRDFKSSNILLDEEFNPKLSDFGLAREGPTGDGTHVTTQVMGTYGYVAPEYADTGRLTSMSDVYSFGVVLLELLCGRPAIDQTKAREEQNLVDWAKPRLNDIRKLRGIMDRKLGGLYPKEGAIRCASIAGQCINSEPRSRPKISRVLEMLQQLE